MSANGKDDTYWMQQALLLAKEAEARQEVPVGALVVLNGELVGRGFNQPISACDPSAHAEIMALRDAAQHINNYRLVDATLYVTLEPCTMCAGAIVHSRIKRLVYGAKEPKAGVITSQAQLLDAGYMNYRVESLGGVCEQECSELLTAFFSKRRAQKKNKE